MLSELQALVRAVTPPTGRRVPKEEFPGFSYQILIGEAAISEADKLLNVSNAEDAGSEGGNRSNCSVVMRAR